MARALAAWARDAQRDCGGRATREDQIHLTLAFLGDADPGVASAAARAAPGTATSLPLEGAHYWKHNRIVWVGAEKAPAPLAALARALGETRQLAAHVTLIRKAREPRRPLPPLPALEWPIREFALVNSRLEPEGPVYAVLERFPLA